MTSSIAGSSTVATSLRSRSDMYLTAVGSGTIVRTQNFWEKLDEFRNFLFDDSKGTIFNRSPVDLLLWVLLHVGIFASSGLVTGFLLWIHYHILNWNSPTLQRENSLLQTPGLSFRPQIDIQSTVIRFSKGNTNTYYHYVDDIDAYLRYYENENQQGENFIDCSEIRERRPEEELDKVCRFNMEWLGSDCVKQQNFGFDDGQPCILLKLNKVFDWIPMEYTNETVPDEIREIWSPWSIAVKCEGETAMDRENMGPVRYFPANGFHFRHFPFRNQQGYRSPLVFVRFDRPTPGSMVMVTCRAYARNIVHDRNQMVSMTHFELLVD